MYGLRNQSPIAVNVNASDTTHAAPGAAAVGGSLPARRITRERRSSQEIPTAAATTQSVTMAPESSVAWLGSSGAGGASRLTPVNERISSRARPTPKATTAPASHHSQRPTG